MILVINLWMIRLWVKIHPKQDDSCHQYMDDLFMGQVHPEQDVNLWMILVGKKYNP